MLYKVLTAPRIFGVSAARLSHRAHFDASEAEGWASGLVSAVRVVCVGFLLFLVLFCRLVVIWGLCNLASCDPRLP